MVRWPSGVTWIRQRAVGAPAVAGAELKATPSARMSWAKTWPSWSALTFPI
jgi:hypothetical protein